MSLLSSAQSINPKDFRTQGILSVFAGESTGLRALGRSAVGEAELELRSWYESHPQRTETGFPPDAKGKGLVAERFNSAFPLSQAVELLRLKCVSFSVSASMRALLMTQTLAPQGSYSKTIENSVLSSWRGAGGDASDDTISPSALWGTAILE